MRKGSSTIHRFAASPTGAFTLVELLVVIAIVTVMASLTMATMSTVKKKGAMMEDVSAGRTLIAAYLTNATDNNGQFMYSVDLTGITVKDERGKSHTGLVAQRYPYRLAPYLDYQIEGTFVTSANREAIRNAAKSADPAYGPSVYPTFGISELLIGGKARIKNNVVSISFPDDCATSLTQLTHPIIAFATSSGAANNATGSHGYFYVQSPKTYVPIWSSEEWDDANSHPAQYGNVHPRHGGKVLAAMTDGTVQSYTVEQLRDMRLWNKNAAAADDPDYTMPSP